MRTPRQKYNEARVQNVRAPLFSLIIGLLYFVLQQTGPCVSLEVVEEDAGRGRCVGGRVDEGVEEAVAGGGAAGRRPFSMTQCVPTTPRFYKLAQHHCAG